MFVNWFHSTSAQVSKKKWWNTVKSSRKILNKRSTNNSLVSKIRILKLQGQYENGQSIGNKTKPLMNYLIWSNSSLVTLGLKKHRKSLRILSDLNMWVTFNMISKVLSNLRFLSSASNIFPNIILIKSTWVKILMQFREILRASYLAGWKTKKINLHNKISNLFVKILLAILNGVSWTKIVFRTTRSNNFSRSFAVKN